MHLWWPAMIFSAVISSSRGSNIWNLYLDHFRDYYCACDSDYYDDDEIFHQNFQAVFVLLFNYQVKIFLPGKGQRSCMICSTWRPSTPPSSSLYGVRIPVLKSPWILGGVLEKSLNSIFPWKVFKFLCKSLKCPWIFFSFESSGLKSVFFCNAFWLSKTRYKF